jgi:predicted HAD superfamily Cof-like phosphohydrolase
MSTGLNPTLTGPKFDNFYSPIGASGDPLSGAVKSLPGAILGKLKGLWQSVRGNAKPERSVVDAGPGDYRLQRKGQSGYERLQVIGKATPQARATYASPEAARTRVVPLQAASGASTASSVADAPATLDTLSKKILEPAYAQLSTPRDEHQLKKLADPVFALAHFKQVEQRETKLLADLGNLVKLADAANEPLRPDASGRPLGAAAKAFNAVVGEILSLRLGGTGELFGKLAKAAPGDVAAVRQAAYDHATGTDPAAEVVHSADARREVAINLLGQGLRYAPSSAELTLDGISPEDQAFLQESRLMEAEFHVGQTLSQAVDAIADGMLKLQQNGLLTADVLRPLGAYQPMSAMATGTSESNHVRALPILAIVVESLAQGNPAMVDRLTGGDSRHDDVALKLKTAVVEVGPKRDRAVLEHTLSAAKRQLATVWTQQEKISRIEGSTQTLGGVGRLGTRMGAVINPGGSDGLRIDAKLIRALREGPSTMTAREASARGGAGIQPTARAGKDVNLLIAHVMLLQKRVDADAIGGTPKEKTAQARQALHQAVLAMPDGLGAKLAAALSPRALAPTAVGDLVSVALAHDPTHALFTQANQAQQRHDEAQDLRSRLASPDYETRTQAQSFLTSEQGLYTDIVADMNAVPPSGTPATAPSQAERLDVVIAQRQSVADTKRAAFSTAVGGAKLSAPDLGTMTDTLQAIGTLKAAERTEAQRSEDSSLGLSEQDFIDMGFGADEAATVMQELKGAPGSDIEKLFTQGLRSSADARQATDAVNNGIDKLFVKGNSHLTQSTMRDVSKAFPEAEARSFLAAVRDLANPVTGSTAQSTSAEIFAGMFRETLGSADKPLGLFLQKTGSDVADAQVQMAKLVGDLATLDSGAKTAREAIDAMGKAAEPRKIDPNSATAKANATRLESAAQTLATLDLVTAGIGTATTRLAAFEQEANVVIGAAQTVVDDAQAAHTAKGHDVDRLTTRQAEILRGLAPGEMPESVVTDLKLELRTVTQELSDAKAAQQATQSALDGAKTVLAQTKAVLAEDRAPLARILEVRQNFKTELEEKLATEIKTLRWMSQTSLERSVRPQARIETVVQLRDFLAKAGNREAMQALHTLNGLPAAKAGKITQITEQAGVADERLVAYRAAFSAAPQPGVAPEQLQAAIRCAVLETALAWPDGAAQFDPVEHRQTIDAKLQEWGIDSSLARPEIDAIVNQKFDLANLERWSKDAEKAFKAPEPAAPGAVRRAFDAARVFVTDSSPLDTGTRRALIDSVRSMRVGDSLGLARGLSWSLDTTPTPVEATGTLTAQLAVDIKSRNAMEVTRTDAGIKIVFKAGMDGAGSLGIGATVFGAAKVNLTAKGGGQSLEGVALRFDTVEAAATFLDTVLDGKKISPRTWAQAAETALVSDSTVSLGAQLDAKATAKNLAAKVPGAKMVTQYLMAEGEVAGSGFEFLGGVQAKLAASREWNTVEQRNATGHMVAKERKTTLEGSISLGIWSSLSTIQDAVIDKYVDSNPAYTAIDDLVNSNKMMSGAPQGAFGASEKDYGGPDNHVFDPFSPASVKTLSVTLASKRVLTEGTSLAFERDGLLSATGNTMTRSVVVTGKAGLQDLALLQPGFSSRSARTRGDDSLHNAVMRMQEGPAKAMLDELFAAAKPGTSLSVTYALKEDVRQIINDRLKEAEGATKRGDLGLAGRAGDIAKALYEDEKNYVVDTIQVAKRSGVDNSTTLIGLGIISAGRVSEGSTERPTMILAMPDGPTARGMAEAAQPAAPGGGEAEPVGAAVIDGLAAPEVRSADTVVGSGSESTSVQATTVAIEQAAASGEAVVDVVIDLAPSLSQAVLREQTGPGENPTVLVRVDVLATKPQVSAPQAVVAQAPRWDTALVNSFERSVLPAVEAVPVGQMHVEVQSGNACAVHSINAFVGGQAFDIPTFDTWVKASTDLVRREIGKHAPPPESGASGFSPERVESALQLIQGSPAVKAMNWEIGMSLLSPQSGESSIKRATLPPFPVTTDRLVIDVEITRPARPNVEASSLDHMVAFRKDDQGEWWLLDSRDTGVEVHPSDAVGPGTGVPIRQKITPQAWLDKVMLSTELTGMALIGPGISKNAVSHAP